MGIFEVFYQPGKLFSSLSERRYAWVVPLILGVLLTVGTTIAVVNKIGLTAIVRQQLETNRTNMTPEQMQRALDTADSPQRRSLTYTAIAAGAVLAPLVIAGLLSIMAMMASRQPPFGTMLSMVTLAFLPYTVVVSLMTILVLAVSPDPATLDYQNLLATNVGAFMNRDTTPRSLYALLNSIDVLTLCEIGLMSYGFSKLTRSSIFFGIMAVGGIWALWVLIKVALTALF